MWYIAVEKHNTESCVLVSGGYNSKEEADRNLYKAQNMAQYTYPNDDPNGFDKEWYTIRLVNERKSLFGVI